MNPVDIKVRAGNEPDGEPRVLGFDAAGVVAAIGGDVSLFEAGDEVYYAGSIARPGTTRSSTWSTNASSGTSRAP